MTPAAVFIFLTGVLIGLAIMSHELRYTRGQLQDAKTRTAETYRKAAYLLERETYLETMIEAFLIEYGPRGVSEESIAEAKRQREATP